MSDITALKRELVTRVLSERAMRPPRCATREAVRIRLGILDRGLRVRTMLAMIRVLSRHPVADAVKLALYHPDFYRAGASRRRPCEDAAHPRPFAADHQEDNHIAVPELLVDFIASLDGYAAADGWPGWWGLEGPEYLAWLGQQPEADYVILMGTTTYRVMSTLAGEGEPGTDVLAGMSKVVFSTTLKEPLSWANTRLVSQDAVEAVRDMKEKGSEPLRTIGSLSLCRSLLKAGLVDRFRVVVFPVITGSSGRERIYDGYPDVALDMIRSRTFDGRIQLLEYVPTVLSGPPRSTRPPGTTSVS